MPVKLKSSQVQQNFGQAMDRALLEDDVIVERYGTPRVAIVEYRRYRRLVEAEKELLRARLQQASAAASARAAHLSEQEVDELIEPRHLTESNRCRILGQRPQSAKPWIARSVAPVALPTVPGRRTLAFRSGPLSKGAKT